MRHFRVADDMRAVGRWVESERTRGLVGRPSRDLSLELQRINVRNLLDRQHQVFTCLLNRAPVMQVDICAARHDYALFGEGSEGDYLLTIIPSPMVFASVELFRCCIGVASGVFFSVSGIKRLLLISPEGYLPAEWLHQAGFLFDKDISFRQEASALYSLGKGAP